VDLYQLLAYCLALRTTPGYIVYAAGDAHAVTYRIRNSGVEIVVMALDLDQAPTDLLAGIHKLARHVSRRSASRRDHPGA
jgi:5-methylcytosine-specific restriction enzyme subunit McrC